MPCARHASFPPPRGPRESAQARPRRCERRGGRVPSRGNIPSFHLGTQSRRPVQLGVGGPGMWSNGGRRVAGEGRVSQGRARHGCGEPSAGWQAGSGGGRASAVGACCYRTDAPPTDSRVHRRKNGVADEHLAKDRWQPGSPRDCGLGTRRADQIAFCAKEAPFFDTFTSIGSCALGTNDGLVLRSHIAR
jgi:hypothetical protein